MRRTRHRALFLGPAERVQAERGPVLRGVAARIHLLLQAQEAEVSVAMRTEAGDLDVVAEQIRVLGDLVVRGAEKLLLIIKVRAPREIRANLQILAHRVAD